MEVILTPPLAEPIVYVTHDRFTLHRGQIEYYMYYIHYSVTLCDVKYVLGKSKLNELRLLW